MLGVEGREAAGVGLWNTVRDLLPLLLSLVVGCFLQMVGDMATTTPHFTVATRTRRTCHSLWGKPPIISGNPVILDGPGSCLLCPSGVCCDTGLRNPTSPGTNFNWPVSMIGVMSASWFLVSISCPEEALSFFVEGSFSVGHWVSFPAYGGRCSVLSTLANPR